MFKFARRMTIAAKAWPNLILDHSYDDKVGKSNNVAGPAPKPAKFALISPDDGGTSSDGRVLTLPH